MDDMESIKTPRESQEDHRVYMEEIPRIREIYIRCDEKLTYLGKIAKNVFKIMTNIVLEITEVNDQLYGLYDIENNEKPEIMVNQWIKREEICEFLNKWKKVEQNQMYCFYKYWLLNMKYEHQDCLAILDIFIRYDIVYNKYQKIMQQYDKQKKKKNKNNDNKDGMNDVIHDEQNDIDDDDDNKYNDNKDIDEESKRKIKGIKMLLDTVCKIILKEQMTKLWEKKADNFNDQVEQFRQKYIKYSLHNGDSDDFV